ncbi:TonB family protein, partial [Leptospira sp. SA-E8]|uniref:energy transducer TonB n=1 Tax=Leptospira sp. SA-E8 TaxID=3422259 RepID=UPI003EBE3734
QEGSAPGVDEDMPGIVMSEIITPAPNIAEKVQSAPKPVPQQPKVAPRPEPTPPLQDAPSELFKPEPTPAPSTPQPTPPIDAPAVATESAAPPPAQRTQQPSVDASYLNNPRPAYPDISRRLNEQGQVIVRVLIGPKGEVLQAEVGKSSGFDRLDRTALAAVRRWRYLPGKRDGMAEAMWFNVPVNFVLDQ